MSTPTSQSTGEIVPGSTAAFVTGRTFLNSVTIQPGATITIFDSLTAAGTVIFKYVNAGTSTASVVFRNAIRLDTGMSYTVAAANANIYYGAT